MKLILPPIRKIEERKKEHPSFVEKKKSLSSINSLKMAT